MAVAKNTGDSGTVNAHTAFNSNDVSLNHTLYTIGAGTDVVLLAILTFANSGSTDISGLTVTWAGTPMNRLGIGSVNGGRAEIWYLSNPATGNQTCAAAWTGGSDCVIGLISFTGAGTPIDITPNSGNDASPTVTVPSDVNGATVAVAVSRIATINNSNQTEIYLDTAAWPNTEATYAIGGTPSNAHNWTTTSGLWASLGVHIPVPGGGSSARPFMTQIGALRI